MGLGNRPNKAESLTENKEEKLWSSSQLGTHSPESLLNTVWYVNTKLLGIGVIKMEGGIELKIDENRQGFFLI